MNSIQSAVTTNHEDPAVPSSGFEPSQHRLLILDVDEQLCLMLRELYARIGYSVDFESDGERGVARAEQGHYDLLIVGLATKTLDGFAVIRRIRRHSSLPIVVLSGGVEKTDRLKSFDLGADDYVVKPFDPDELLARTRALLRRSQPAIPASEPLVVGDLRLLPGEQDASLKGRPLGLTAMECDILKQLMRSCGRVVSRDCLSLHLYDRLPTPFDRSLDQHVSRLRKKLGSGCNMILSIRGVGYQLRRPEQTEEW